MVFTTLVWFILFLICAFIAAAMIFNNGWLLIGACVAVILIFIFIPLANSEYPSCIIVDIKTYEKYHGILYYIAKKECVIEKTGEKYIEYELVIIE